MKIGRRVFAAHTKLFPLVGVLVASSVLFPAHTLSAANNWYNFDTGFSSVVNIGRGNNINADRTIPEFIKDAVNVALGVVGIIAVAALVYGGFTYIISLGEEDKTRTAKRIIFYALIGLVVIGAAGVVVNVVVNDIIQKGG